MSCGLSLHDQFLHQDRVKWERTGPFCWGAQDWSLTLLKTPRDGAVRAHKRDSAQGENNNYWKQGMNPTSGLSLKVD